MVTMINKRATVLANPDRYYPRRWNKKNQNDFERVLRYFDNTNTEDRNRFEEKNIDGLPAMKAWHRINSI